MMPLKLDRQIENSSVWHSVPKLAQFDKKRSAMIKRCKQFVWPELLICLAGRSPGIRPHVAQGRPVDVCQSEQSLWAHQIEAAATVGRRTADVTQRSLPLGLVQMKLLSSSDQLSRFTQILKEHKSFAAPFICSPTMLRCASTESPEHPFEMKAHLNFN